jgi:hypothetical protein
MLQICNCKNYINSKFLGFEVSRNIKITARCWWLTPVTLATWEAEIRRIAV